MLLKNMTKIQAKSIRNHNDFAIRISSDSHVYKFPIKEKEVRIRPDRLDIKELWRVLKESMDKQKVHVRKNSFEMKNYQLKTLDRLIDDWKSRNSSKFLLRTISNINDPIYISKKTLINHNSSRWVVKPSEPRRFIVVFSLNPL